MRREYQIKNEHFEQLFDEAEFVWMGQNTNHFPTCEAVKEAMIKSIMLEEYHKYPPPLGLKELRSLILNDLGAYDAEVLVTNGAVEALHELSKNFIKTGDDFVTTDPGWFTTVQFAKYYGANVIFIPIYGEEIGYKLTPELLEEYITPKTRTIYLVDPNNPLGSSYTEKEVKAFCEIAEGNKALLIHDSTYRDFADAHFPAVRYNHEWSAVVYSFSKSCGLAGLRIGALVSNEDVVEKVARAQVNAFGLNTVAQRGAIEALKTKKQWIGNVVSTLRRHQALIKEAIDKTDEFFITVYPSQGNFFAIDVTGSELTPEEICCKFLDYNMLVRHGAYQSIKFGGDFIKVSFSVPTRDVKRFCELFPKIPKEIKEKSVKMKPLF